MRFRFAALVVAALALPVLAQAQPAPVAAGTLEIQGGIGAIGLPEGTDGTYSAQPELRVGFFLSEGIELQAAGSIRMWPLGTVAPHNASAAAHLLWYPSLGPGHRNLYLLAGGGIARNDPPGFLIERTFDPLARIGFGFKIPLAALGLGAMSAGWFTTEFRSEVLFEEFTSPVAGIAVGYSYFL
ncbi:MAG TPA: hypothetical protein VKU85_17445 [bacterium]|nr:hypothetical protein [bacterium]